MIQAAWLRSIPNGEAQPTSEAAFFADPTKYNVLHPIQMAGRLQGDGSWLVDSYRWSETKGFGGRLNEYRAANPDVLYIPIFEIDRYQFVDILPNRDLHRESAEAMRDMALAGGWGGVLFDCEKIKPADTYREDLSNFIYEMSHAIRKAGLQFWIWSRGRAADKPTGIYAGDIDDAYILDMKVVGQCADKFVVSLGGYWRPLPKTPYPYWWQRECVEYALDKGIPAQNLILHPACLCIWTDAAGVSKEISYEYAQGLLDAAGSKWSWRERNINGLDRILYADGEFGSMVGHDADTMQHRFAMVDEFGLAGWSLYGPGLLPIGL